MNRLSTTTLTFALALGFQSAHAADTPQDSPSLVVQYADLDVSHSAGATALYRRLKGAAETVCAPFDGRDLASRTTFNACVQSALATAVAKVNQPALTSYYKAKTNARNATTQVAQG
jgi:UrcA family protein